MFESARGDAYDNAMAEAWVATFKSGLVDGRRFPSFEQRIPLQNTSFVFTKRLAAERIVASMGTVGGALDNAMCESLIGTMKIEKLDRQPWRSIDDVRAAAFDWIETWYNRRRRHSSLGYLSPLEFESQHYDGHPITNP